MDRHLRLHRREQIRKALAENRGAPHQGEADHEEDQQDKASAMQCLRAVSGSQQDCEGMEELRTYHTVRPAGKRGTQD
jgi:hypothetical protein